jgi:hypothetical protein
MKFSHAAALALVDVLNALSAVYKSGLKDSAQDNQIKQSNL